jgi:hypothetical protein
MIILYIFLALLGLAVVITAVEVAFLLLQKPVPDSYDSEDADKYSLNIKGKSLEDLYLYLCGIKESPSFTEDEVYALLFKQSEYMNKRFDCADFRAQMLFKIYKDCPLNEKCKTLIKDAFLNFKYFMDEPGDDSMCYWSENHQILFAVSEYLAGQEWPDEIFTNDGKTGKEHMQKAITRIDAWMQQRFYYGFSEYLSNNYLAEDIAPMANFIVYSNVKKARALRSGVKLSLFVQLGTQHTADDGSGVNTSGTLEGFNNLGDITHHIASKLTGIIADKVDFSAIIALTNSLCNGR